MNQNVSECIRNHHLFSQHLSTISPKPPFKSESPIQHCQCIEQCQLEAYQVQYQNDSPGVIVSAAAFLITLTWLKYQSFVFAWKCFANEMDDKVTDTIIVYRVCQYINVR